MMADAEEKTSVDFKEMKDFLKSITPDQLQGKKQKSKPIPLGAQNTYFFINRDLSEFLPVNKHDEVYQGIFLGDRHLAIDGEMRQDLQHLKITHILNAAQGERFAQVDTTEHCYSDLNIKFMGINAMDTQNCKLNEHFDSASLFINDALESGGRVYVHCNQGISRSATLVLAYLMTYKKITLKEAIKTVRTKRAIFPNDGFLKLLCNLHNELYASNTG